MTTLHPKVKVPAVVGVALTVATIIAHVVSGQTAVPWLATYGATAVTVLMFISGYFTPAPIPEASAATVKDLLSKVENIVQAAEQATGTPVVKTDTAFPEK